MGLSSPFRSLLVVIGSDVNLPCLALPCLLFDCSPQPYSRVALAKKMLDQQRSGHGAGPTYNFTNNIEQASTSTTSLGSHFCFSSILNSVIEQNSNVGFVSFLPCFFLQSMYLHNSQVNVEPLTINTTNYDAGLIPTHGEAGAVDDLANRLGSSLSLRVGL